MPSPVNLRCLAEMIQAKGEDMISLSNKVLRASCERVRARLSLRESPVSQEGQAKAMPPFADGSLGLALAVVGASEVPLLLLDANLAVIAASGSFWKGSA